MNLHICACLGVKLRDLAGASPVLLPLVLPEAALPGVPVHVSPATILDGQQQRLFYKSAVSNTKYKPTIRTTNLQLALQNTNPQLELQICS